MPDRFSISSPALSVSGARAAARRSESSPFRILIAGDFSGRENRGLSEPVAGRSSRRIDLDTFDAVMARIAPGLTWDAGGVNRISLTFRSLDDFHPDRLWAENEFFRPHREFRAELENPARFAAAMASVASAPVQPSITPDVTDPLGGLPGLDRPVPESATPAATVAGLIRDAMAGHTLAAADPRQPEMLAAFDAALSGQMRAVLHHPDFQALEAAWRAVDFLLRNLDTDETLEVSLLDLSKTELAADLRATDDPRQSGFGQWITARTGGETAFTVMAGLYSFDQRPDDADDLSRLADIMHTAGIPFIAAAGRGFVEAARQDNPSAPGEAWFALRDSPLARSIGLVAPGFLLRQPYGRGSDEIESFAFEEIPAGNPGHGLLWANGAILAVQLLAAAWRENGWGFPMPDNAEVSGLPLHVFTEDGERRMTPCAEVLLTDRQYAGLGQLGIMPLASIRGRDAVRLLKFQSISRPAAPLEGL